MSSFVIAMLFVLLRDAFSQSTNVTQLRGAAAASTVEPNLTANDSALEAAWGSKVICPGYGFYSSACLPTLSYYRPSAIVAWSGGVSTAALGYAINGGDTDKFAAWVVTHPLYTGWGTAFEFYKKALTHSAFSWLNSRLYAGMFCFPYYYLLHDFASSEDMAKALATSGGESFTGSTHVNGVDLSNCQDAFGGTEFFTGGIPAQARGSLGYSTGLWVNVYKHSGLNPTPTLSTIKSIINAAPARDAQSISTSQTFTNDNCLCTRNGCNWGC